MPRSSVFASWGSSAVEQRAAYECDQLIEHPDLVLHRAIDIAAPGTLLYRWLCQLRVAPYSYDWIDNRGRRSPQHLIDGLDELAVGQRFMTIFQLASFDPGHSVTLDSTTGLFGQVAVTYRVNHVSDNRSRLVVKGVVATPRTLLGAIMRRVLPTGDLIMMRKQLLTLKTLAEREVPGSTCEP